MANYIGNAPVSGEFKHLDSIASQFNGSTTTFSLLFNGVSQSVGDASQLIVSLNGVVQEPLTAYTLGTGGSTAIFSSAPASGSTCFIVKLGGVGGTTTPSDNSVTTAKIASGAVTSAKLDTNITVSGTANVGSYVGSVVNSPLDIKADTSHFGLSIEENNGTETWQLGVDVDGDLNFHNSGSATPSVTFNDAGNVGIGTTNPSGKLHVITTDTSDTLTLESTNADATVGPVLNLFRNSASPANNDLLGRILFKADDSAGNASTFARIEVVATDVTNGSEDARMEFYTAVNDAFNPTLNLVGGKVGIGTTSPNTALEVKQTSGTAAIRVHADHVSAPRAAIEFMRGTTDTFGGDAYTDWKLGQVGTTQADFAIISHDTTRGENARLTIEYDTGNVGVGENAPLGKLHIKDGDAGSITTNSAHDTVIIEGSGNTGINIFSPNTSYQYLAFGDPEGANSGYVRYQHSTNQMVLRAGTTDTLYINSDGNVGIGTNNPQCGLNIFGESTSNWADSNAMYNKDHPAFLMITNRQETVGVESGIIMRAKTTGAGVWSMYSKQTANYLADLHFRGRNAGTTSAVRMTLKSDGDVGIGTTAPADKMHIYNSTGTTVYKAEVNSNSTVGFGILKTGSTNQEWAIADGITHNGALQFYDGTDSAVRMHIDGSGKVGIGTTSPAEKLEVSGNIKLSGGINFGSTGGNVTSKTLDDYEEGTFTPNVGSSSGSGGAASGATGNYTRIGNRVFADFFFTVNTLGSMSGVFYIVGFPYTSKASNVLAQGAVRSQGIGGSNDTPVSFEMVASNSYGRFHFMSGTSGQRTVQVSDISAGDFMAASISYIV